MYGPIRNTRINEYIDLKERLFTPLLHEFNSLCIAAWRRLNWRIHRRTSCCQKILTMNFRIHIHMTSVCILTPPRFCCCYLNVVKVINNTVIAYNLKSVLKFQFKGCDWTLVWQAALRVSFPDGFFRVTGMPCYWCRRHVVGLRIAWVTSRGDARAHRVCNYMAKWIRSCVYICSTVKQLVVIGFVPLDLYIPRRST